MPAKNVTVKAHGKRYSHWFRMYADFIDDPKTATLTERQGWAWVRLLAIAKRSSSGVLPSTRDIAFHLRCSFCDAENVISDLIEVGLLDVISIDAGGSRIKPHAWDERQFQWDGRDVTQAERKRRSRSRKRAGHGHVTVDVTENCSESVSVSTVATSKSIQGKNSTSNARTSAHVHANDVEVRS
jgi:hypothetical protein